MPTPRLRKRFSGLSATDAAKAEAEAARQNWDRANFEAKMDMVRTPPEAYAAPSGDATYRAEKARMEGKAMRKGIIPRDLSTVGKPVTSTAMTAAEQAALDIEKDTSKPADETERYRKLASAQAALVKRKR